MNWQDKYPQGSDPTTDEISRAVNSSLWENLCKFIEESYDIAPVIDYSSCSMMPGYNIKYKKSGRALCTLYPAEGSFYCMVVIGNKESEEAGFIIPGFDPYLVDLYKNTAVVNGTRWLMIDVSSPAILENTKELIMLRRKPSHYQPLTE